MHGRFRTSRVGNGCGGIEADGWMRLKRGRRGARGERVVDREWTVDRGFVGPWATCSDLVAGVALPGARGSCSLLSGCATDLPKPPSTTDHPRHDMATVVTGPPSVFKSLVATTKLFIQLHQTHILQSSILQPAALTPRDSGMMHIDYGISRHDRPACLATASPHQLSSLLQQHLRSPPGCSVTTLRSRRSTRSSGRSRLGLSRSSMTDWHLQHSTTLYCVAYFIARIHKATSQPIMVTIIISFSKSHLPYQLFNITLCDLPGPPVAP